MKSKEILKKIESFLEQGSPQQTKIAAYMLENVERVAMHSVTQLAGEIGVSQPILKQPDNGYSRKLKKLTRNEYLSPPNR